MKSYTLAALCRTLGRDALYVRNLQRLLELHVPEGGEGYSPAYVAFMEKITALRALHVPQSDITELFAVEKKILVLLHVDTLTNSPTWYLDDCGACDEKAPSEAGRLLLSGYRLGFSLDAEAVQHSLDFGPRNPELFKGTDMGEDIRRVVDKYLGLLGGVRQRIAKEKPVLENALSWAGRVLKLQGNAGR